MNIIISVKYTLKPGKRQELLSFVSENVRQTRMETGNLAYSHYPCLDREDDMFVFEMWEDIDCVKRHIEAAHYVEFSRRRTPILQAYESRTYDAQLRHERNRAPLA